MSTSHVGMKDTRSPPPVVAASLAARNSDNLIRHYQKPEARRHLEQHVIRQGR